MIINLLAVINQNFLRKKFILAVNLGMTSVEKRGTLIRIVKFKNHPNYVKATYDSDIAVITLQRSITLGPTIQLIHLHTVKPLFFFGDATVSGWGDTSVSDSSRILNIDSKLKSNIFSSGGQASTTLKTLDIPIIDTKECRKVSKYSPTGN